MIGLRCGVPGKGDDHDRTSVRQLRCGVERRAVEQAIAVAVVLRVEAREEELARVQAAVGIVVRVGRRGAGVALRRQGRIGLGQAAVGDRGGQERIFHVVGPGIDDVAEDRSVGGKRCRGHDHETGHERTAGDAVARHAVANHTRVEQILVGSVGRRIAQEFAVKLVAVDVVDPGVDVARLKLVGDVDLVVVRRQGRARGQAHQQAGSRMCCVGIDPVAAGILILERDGRSGHDVETRSGSVLPSPPSPRSPKLPSAVPPKVLAEPINCTLLL